MSDAAVADNELARIQALEDYDVLDTGPESHFDDIARVASQVCQVPVALIGLMDRDRLFLKSRVGLSSVSEVPRNISFCDHVLVESGVLEVPDLAGDPRFSDNPQVVDSPHFRFYAGVPLLNRDGFVLGSLCVLDYQPRQLSEAQKESLLSLGRIVMSQLEQRRQVHFSAHVGRIIEESDYFVAMMSFDRKTFIYGNTRLRRFFDASGQDHSLLEVSPDRVFPSLSREVLAQYALPGSEAQIKREIAAVPMRSASGEEKTVSLQLIPSTVGSRSVLLLVAQDMEPLLASRRKAEKAVDEVRNLALVARLTQNPVIITDAENRVQWVNPSFEELTGYSLEEVRGRQPGRLLQGPDTSVEARRRIRQHLEAGLPVRQEILNYSRSGRPYWLELDIQPVRNEQGELISFVAVEIDITQRKEQEQQLLRAKDAAEASNRSKSMFLANISHELRTPLNGIVGISELLRKNPQREDLSSQLSTLNDSSRGLLSIINDLLDLSKIEADSLSLESQPFDLHKLLGDLDNLFRPMMENKGIRLHLVGLSVAPRFVQGDSLRLRQILTNLLGNALKFTERGFVELAVEQGACLGDTHSLVFRVRDSGIGIAEDSLERIFEPFAQADNSLSRRYGGTGLGLAICRRLVELMGGEISVSSVPGKGTTISFNAHLLASSEEELDTSLEPVLEDGAQDLATGCRVLVVDDNPINCHVAAAMLTELGAMAVARENGQAAMEAFSGETFDLVLIDIQMPDMDGFTLARELRLIDQQRHRRTPFIALTAYSTAEYLQHKGSSDIDSHVCKPLTFQNLSQVLVDHLGRSYNVEAHSDESPEAGDAPLTEALIDRSLVMANLNGDLKLVDTLVQLFLGQYQQYSDDVRSALEAGELTRVAEVSHSLKGAVGYFNRGGLWQEIAAMEKQARAGDAPGVRRLFTVVQPRLGELAEEITRTDWAG
ncbi:MAG: ATP-binding protein [Oleiphilaceae bacterium]|nr:ATP-binding protein [Oleiphilaceae bacterium]